MDNEKIITMKYLAKTMMAIAFGAAIVSCNKREIIPAPEPRVELKNHFIGKIGATVIELTQNVNGYDGTSGVDLIINATTLDSAIYHSTFSSSQSLRAISVGHGSLVFDAASSEHPSKAQFESFYKSGLNQSPAFSTSGLHGFTVTYTDGAGKQWRSNATHAYGQESAEYVKMDVESDKTGDYAKFKVKFNTYVYNTYFDEQAQTNKTDSLLMTDAVYTGWYKR